MAKLKIKANQNLKMKESKMSKEKKSDKTEFLRRVDKELRKGNLEYKRYLFRLSLIGGTDKEKKEAIEKFESQMGKVEIRQGNTDCRIEMLVTAIETLKPKPHMGTKEVYKFAKKLGTISEKTKMEVVFTRSGTPFLDE